MPERCDGCRFGVLAALGGEVEPALICHRFPPTTVHIPEPFGFASEWPVVADDDWCGEFQPAPAVAA